MKTLFILLFLFLFVFIIFKLLTRKFSNPYTLCMVFGKKGSGKSTLLTKLALKYHKKGWTVYSTEYTPCSYHIDYNDIGFVHLNEHSVLLIDEVGMIWDNRQYKNFKPQVRDFFKLQRHYKIKCFLFSQTFDIDKKLRDLTDHMFLIINVFSVFSYGKRINKKIVLTEATGDQPSSIAENLKFDSFLLFWAGSRTFTFIPRYAKYFNSFDAPVLPQPKEVFLYVEPLKKDKKIYSGLRFARFGNRIQRFFKRTR